MKLNVTTAVTFARNLLVFHCNATKFFVVGVNALLVLKITREAVGLYAAVKKA